MIQDVKAPVSVLLAYNHQKQRVFPSKIVWDGRAYTIKSVGMHYKYKNGRSLIHVFSANSETLSFKLVLDTENLFWTMEQISDGLPD